MTMMILVTRIVLCVKVLPYQGVTLLFVTHTTTTPIIHKLPTVERWLPKNIVLLVIVQCNIVFCLFLNIYKTLCIVYWLHNTLLCRCCILYNTYCVVYYTCCILYNTCCIMYSTCTVYNPYYKCINAAICNIHFVLSKIHTVLFTIHAVLCMIHTVHGTRQMYFIDRGVRCEARHDNGCMIVTA